MGLREWIAGRLETRSTVGTDALVAALVARATGKTVATGAGTSALEAAASQWALALAGATVTGPGMYVTAVTPGVLALIGRELIRRGECVFEIVTAGGLQLIPASAWNVRGDAHAWTYEITTAGPSRTGTRRKIPAAAVLHFRYAVDPSRPWIGLGPLQFASLGDKLAGAVEGQLGDESAGPVGQLIPIPGDGQDSTVTGLREDLGSLQGRAALVETHSTWKRGQAPRGGGGSGSEWQPRRLGASPGAPLVDLYSAASRAVLAACGVPVELVEASAATGGRESWRRFIFGRVAPLARILEGELRAKLDRNIGLTFGELRASDLAARARAYGTLIGAEMDAGEARRHTGFDG